MRAVRLRADDGFKLQHIAEEGPGFRKPAAGGKIAQSIDKYIFMTVCKHLSRKSFNLGWPCRLPGKARREMHGHGKPAGSSAGIDNAEPAVGIILLFPNGGSLIIARIHRAHAQVEHIFIQLKHAQVVLAALIHGCLRG